MEAEQVIEKIISDASEKVANIKEQARQKLDDEQKKSRQQLEEYKKQTEQLARTRAEEKRQQLLAGARMSIARERLAEKRKILDELFSQAREKLDNLPDGEYLKLVTNLMARAAQTGDEQVIIGRNEKRIDADLIKKINTELPEDKGKLTLSDKKASFNAGFILERGKIKTNVSFGVLLESARDELEIDMAKELFGT